MQLDGAQDGDCSAGARGELAASWEWGDGEEGFLFSTAAALLHVKQQLSKCETCVCPRPWRVAEEPDDSPLLARWLAENGPALDPVSLEQQNCCLLWDGLYR